MTVKPRDILVNFDFVSLFTMVPAKRSLDRLRENFSKGITALFQHVLNTAHFKWENQFYEQLDRVAIRNPVNAVIANYYMKAFQERALSSAPKKPTIRYRYVDDTFVIWLKEMLLCQNFYRT